MIHRKRFLKTMSSPIKTPNSPVDFKGIMHEALSPEHLPLCLSGRCRVIDVVDSVVLVIMAQHGSGCGSIRFSESGTNLLVETSGLFQSPTGWLLPYSAPNSEVTTSEIVTIDVVNQELLSCVRDIVWCLLGTRDELRDFKLHAMLPIQKEFERQVSSQLNKRDIGCFSFGSVWLRRWTGGYSRVIERVYFQDPFYIVEVSGAWPVSMCWRIQSSIGDVSSDEEVEKILTREVSELFTFLDVICPWE